MTKQKNKSSKKKAPENGGDKGGEITQQEFIDALKKATRPVPKPDEGKSKTSE